MFIRFVLNLIKFCNSCGYSFVRVPLLSTSGCVRYDLTATLKSCLDLSILTRFVFYKIGDVFRQERCDVGRYNQFYQFDIDCVGFCSCAFDFFLVLRALQLLLYSGSCVRAVLGNKKVLFGLGERLGLIRYNVKFLKLLRVLDKSLFYPFWDVVGLFTFGRFDVSGDFVIGLGLTRVVVFKVLSILYCRRFCSSFNLNCMFLVLVGSFSGEFGIRELLFYSLWCLSFQILDKFVLILPLLSRGLNYYTGLLFEIVTNVVVLNARNTFVKIGSLVGGGRYDNFVAKFGFGYSFGVDRLLDYYVSCSKRFCFRSMAVCICLRLDQFYHNFVFELVYNLKRFGYRVSCFICSSFLLALKLSMTFDWLFILSGAGVYVKSLLKRRFLSVKIKQGLFWNVLFLDQFWVSNVLLISDGLMMFSVFNVYKSN